MFQSAPPLVSIPQQVAAWLCSFSYSLYSGVKCSAGQLKALLEWSMIQVHMSFLFCDTAVSLITRVFPGVSPSSASLAVACAVCLIFPERKCVTLSCSAPFKPHAVIPRRLCCLKQRHKKQSLKDSCTRSNKTPWMTLIPPSSSWTGLTFWAFFAYLSTECVCLVRGINQSVCNLSLRLSVTRKKQICHQKAVFVLQ